MKIVKIILGIVIALTLVFFGTGLLVKETKYIAEVVIDKPLKEVFAKFDDISASKDWMSDIKSIEVVNENPQRIGSKYNLKVMNHGQEIEVLEKILAYVKNQKITLQFNFEGIRKKDDYVFQEQEDRTLIVQNTTMQTNSFLLACTYPWFKSTFAKASQKDLNKFKELLEYK